MSWKLHGEFLQSEYGDQLISIRKITRMFTEKSIDPARGWLLTVVYEEANEDNEPHFLRYGYINEDVARDFMQGLAAAISGL